MRLQLKNILNKIHDNNNIIGIAVFGLILLALIFLLFYASLPTKSITDSFEISKDSDTIISEKSGLGFKNVEFNGDTLSLLGYLTDETLKVDKDGEFIQSINIGKLCISISGSYLNVNSMVTKDVLNDLLTKLCSEFSKDDIELIKEGINIDIPYKITKDDEHIFIDFITYVPNNRKIAIYYRVIVQDVRTINAEMSDVEYNILPESNLDEILQLLGIEKTSFLNESLQEISGVDENTDKEETVIEESMEVVEDTENVEISLENDLNIKEIEQESEPVV